MTRRFVALTLALAGCSTPAIAPPPAPRPEPLAEAAPRPLPLCLGGPYQTERILGLTCCHPSIPRLRHAVVQSRPQFHLCYEQALRRNREAKGTVLARFTIADDGHVPRVCVEESEIDDPLFLECLAEAFTEARLPETPATSGCPTTTVAYPLLFRPVGEG